MLIENYFFLVFILTIIATRLFLYFKSTPAPTIKGFRLHHWMYGLLLIPVGIIFKDVIIYAAGLGLFVDELTYIIIRGKNHKDNYSRTSLIGTLIFIILIFFLRSYLVNLLK